VRRAVSSNTTHWKIVWFLLAWLNSFLGYKRNNEIDVSKYNDAILVIKGILLKSRMKDGIIGE
jgi:hypothetical protein